MSGDAGQAGVRERLWVTKFDHTKSTTPQEVEEIMVENGRIVSITRKELPDGPSR